jgi:hypothetical protein
MSSSSRRGFNRRQFVQAVGSAAGTIGALGVAGGRAAAEVSLVVDPADPIAGAAPVQWAVKELEDSLSARGVTVRKYERVVDAPAGGLCILAAGANAAQARNILKNSGVTVIAAPESLGIVPGKTGGRSVLLACGQDSSGLKYALLELADQAQNASDPAASLAARKTVVERPANAVRGVVRMFTSDVEDKPWYNDREMWPRYLTMLAAQRFNRFHLAFGIGYDFLTNVTDAYLLFAYPFLLSVPGYNVRAPQLPDAERDRNLEMLRFISEQAVARGLHFQLGLWMHGYKWIDSPNPNYTIEGLTAETHGPYCRDAVRALLKACPAISGVTFRVHGESGVDEGSYDFWKTVFEGVTTCGRTVEIDMHSKGMDQSMLDVAVATGAPLKLSPKYWAEHIGMPYMQTEIRDQERPKAGQRTSALMKFSAGSRSFLRYGYGDLLREDRKWDVLHRIWPGTQRLLIWGDPVTAAAHSRAFSFCGSAGMELCEPLSFKGRRGSGIAGGRCAYADASLRPRWDWEKYAYSYRVWGRLAYNPETEPDVWRRYLQNQFGAAARPVETALASASRILPIVTTAHCASAANNSYWPEVYLNQSMVDSVQYAPYSDTPVPRVFGNVSPLDPQLFSRINDFADELLKGERSGKYSPIEVAQWIEDYSAAASSSLAQAEAQVSGKDRPEYRRLSIDVAIQAGLGVFFAAKFRAGVLYRIYEQTGDRNALEETVKSYRKARMAWAELADRAKGIYVADITVGEHPQLRGHWLDRLPAIDKDIQMVAQRLEQAKQGEPDARVGLAVQQALGHPRRAARAYRHTPPTGFHPGHALDIELSADKSLASIRLFYRHVDQAERFESREMDAHNNRYRATIPDTYTDSPYPLQYYFEVRDQPESATLYPGFAAELNNQPYFVVRRIRA